MLLIAERCIAALGRLGQSMNKSINQSINHQSINLDPLNLLCLFISIDLT